MSKLIAAVMISAGLAMAGAAPALAEGSPRCDMITALNMMTCPPVNGNTGPQ